MLGIRVWIKKKLSLLWMGKLFAMYFHLTQWRRERCVIMCVNVCLCTNEQLTMLLNLFIDTLHSWIHNHPGLRCRWKHTAYKSRQKGALWDTTWNTLKHTKNMFVCCFTPGVNLIVFLQPFFFFPVLVDAGVLAWQSVWWQIFWYFWKTNLFSITTSRDEYGVF